MAVQFYVRIEGKTFGPVTRERLEVERSSLPASAEVATSSGGPWWELANYDASRVGETADSDHEAVEDAADEVRGRIRAQEPPSFLPRPWWPLGAVRTGLARVFTALAVLSVYGWRLDTATAYLLTIALLLFSLALRVSVIVDLLEARQTGA